jgi:hypothetical protein
MSARVDAQHQRAAEGDPPRARCLRREERALPLLAAALRVPGAAALLARADELVRDGLYGDADSG